MKNNLLAFLIFIANFLQAQIKQKDYYPVYINYPDYTVKATLVSQNKKISIDRDLIYYWYSSNKIQETMGGVDGKILHGLYSSFYLNGNLKEKGNFRTGLKNGEWITWYESGKIKEINTWKKGIRSTTCIYNPGGELVSKTSYRNGKQSGYQFLYKDGAVYEKKKYRKGIEIIPKVKEKKENKGNDSEKESSFKKKYNETVNKIKTHISELKEKRKEKKNKESEKKQSSPAPPKKTEKDKNTFSLKKKEGTEKQTRNKVSAK